ncbi:hypothetical protein [Streptomyces sp. CA-111067]|jgi:hypothetical protein|uniref:hypothetical protein n=1 Tax=Streptomyces sp. CA-111067 TaxID=3240046 RepID=UPI003D98FB21
MHLGAMHALSILAGPSDDKVGPGGLMRSIIVIAVVGSALIAWFVLRGYGNND